MIRPEDQIIILGKILGEIYRIQMKLGILSVDKANLYALLNGFESAIKEELGRIGFISKEQEDHVIDVLSLIWEDQKKIENFNGFYDIEHQLEQGGVDRSTAIAVLKRLYANGQFTDLIAKMDSPGSPSECRRFDLSEWDI